MENADYWRNRPHGDERRDWREHTENWISDYWNSQSHSHRKLIVDALNTLVPFRSVYEVGTNCGPNLAVIHKEWPNVMIGGCDVNWEAIGFGQEKLPEATLNVSSATELIPPDKSWDVVLEDAALMYSTPEEMKKAASEIARVATTGIVICDWFSENEEVKDFHWARDYKKVFADYGFKVVYEHKITEEEWPSKNWSTHGYVFAFRRA